MPRFLQLIQEIPVTLALTGINIVMFLIVWSYDPTLHHQTLIRFGAHYNPLLWDGQYYRLLTCAILHGGVMHLLFNGIALFSLGELLEHVMGSRHYLFLYLFSILAGNVFSLLFMPPISVGVGASGGVMGLAGALSVLLFFDRNQRFLETTSSGRVFFYGLILLNFAVGEWFQIINNAAHFGGFLAGTFYGLFFWSRIPGEKLSRPLGTGILSLAILGVGVMGYLGLFPVSKSDHSFYRSVRAFDQKKVPKALDLLKQASQKSKNPWVIRYQAQVSVQQKKWKEALPLYRFLVEKQPKNSNHWSGLVSTLTHLGKHKEAEKHFKKALKRFGMSRRTPIFLANMLAARHKERKAIALYQQLLERQPNNPELHNNLAWLLVTAVNPIYRNPALALTHIQRSMQLYKRKTSAFLDTYAMVLFRLKRYREAFNALKSAMNAPDSLALMPYLHLQMQRVKAHLPKPKKTPTKKSSPRKKPQKKKQAPAIKKKKKANPPPKDAPSKTR